MYELVNTSLPNGLIAGTHGFATVAMTKGVSDVLRGRLEALCAYTHRTSVHDATYYQQNPVNWFHAILPQGEHVIGRVAPSDFDYTGRTNRLARLRVFAANEMPGAGAAEILAKEKHWFSKSWQGDPKYLDDDRNTCAQLRMLNPVQVSTAPSWDAVFGGNGSRYAQQVAWQIEKNLSAGGRTIYFKTSTAWDVSGEKLLGLFVDVINLLPVDLRQRVTFSTYPVSLPGGTSCNLRGVYDRDKFFDASSSTQAWIDCENAKIVHAEMLPTSGSAKKADVKLETETPVVNGGAAINANNTTSSSPKLGVRRGPAPGGDPYAYQKLLAPKKKGPDMFIVGIIIAGVVVLLGASGFFYWMTQQNKRQMKDSGAAAAVEAEIKSLESDKEEKERLAKEQAEKDRKAAIERAARESAAQQEAERNAKAKKEADAEKRKSEQEKAAKAAADEAALAAARAKKDAESQKKQKTAFMSAHLEGAGSPPKPKATAASAANDVDTIKVYYYIDSGVTLTNEVAGFEPKKDPLTKRINNYKPWVREPKIGLAPLAKSPVVLWLSKGNVWFDWSQHEIKRSQWFKDRDSHDLQIECFGTVDEVYETWNKSSPVTYRITWGDEDGQYVDWSSREFKLKDAIDHVCKAEIERKKKDISQAEKEIADNEKTIERIKKEKAEFDDQIEDYAKETNKLEKLKADLKTLCENRQALKKQKKFDDKAEEKYKNDRRELDKQITGQKAIVQKVNINQVESMATTKKKKLEELEKKARSLNERLEEAKKNYAKELENPDKVARVRSSSFVVTVKGVN